MKEIQKKLEGKQEIQTVALVGMGGAGKTTLARQFGCFYKGRIIWEINAENYTTLVKSFRDLAWEICIKKELNEKWIDIENTNPIQFKEQKILNFVKSQLKRESNWLLIFDNVETLSSLGSYFPKDTETWGTGGKVIVTTQNINIEATNLTNSGDTIFVGNLTPEEKLNLFLKILYGCDECGFSEKAQEEASIFLTDIPPFPLDVSIAAHYIKNNHINYSKYLERVLLYSNELDRHQANLLREVGNYEKTRYKIIIAALEKIIVNCEDFYDLTLFICFLNPQKIPLNLLEIFKNPVLVDQFLHQMQKYSFIKWDSKFIIKNKCTFSIHQSIQKVILEHYLKENNRKNSLKLFQTFNSSLENYTEHLLKNGNLKEIRAFLPHIESFLNYKKTIPNLCYLQTKILLARSLYHSRDDQKSRKILEECLNEPKLKELKNSKQLLQIFVYLGSISMEEGNQKESRYYLEKALKDHSEYLSQHITEVALLLTMMGDIYLDIGEYEKAKEMFGKSVLIYKSYSIDQVGLARALGYYGNSLIHLENYTEARNNLEESLLIYQQSTPENPLNFAWVYVLLGESHRKLGDFKKAKILLEEGLKIYYENLSENHGDIAWALLFLSDFYSDLRDYRKSFVFAEKSMKIYNKILSPNNIRLAEANWRLGNAYKGLKNFRQAKYFLTKAIKVFQENYGENYIETIKLKLDLKKVL